MMIDFGRKWFVEAITVFCIFLSKYLVLEKHISTKEAKSWQKPRRHVKLKAVLIIIPTIFVQQVRSR
jgi:hypothetical protein